MHLNLKMTPGSFLFSFINQAKQQPPKQQHHTGVLPFSLKNSALLLWLIPMIALEMTAQKVRTSKVRHDGTHSAWVVALTLVACHILLLYVWYYLYFWLSCGYHQALHAWLYLVKPGQVREHQDSPNEHQFVYLLLKWMILKHSSHCWSVY